MCKLSLRLQLQRLKGYIYFRLHQNTVCNNAAMSEKQRLAAIFRVSFPLSLLRENNLDNPEEHDFQNKTTTRQSFKSKPFLKTLAVSTHTSKEEIKLYIEHLKAPQAANHSTPPYRPPPPQTHSSSQMTHFRPDRSLSPALSFTSLSSPKQQALKNHYNITIMCNYRELCLG